MTDCRSSPSEPQLRKRVHELEKRNELLERCIAHAGAILGEESSAIAGRANAWLAAIVESSDDAIVSKDLDGIVTSWNPAAERIFGFTAQEMIGAPILRIIPEGLHKEEQHILSKVRAGESIAHYETVRQSKDGALIPVVVSVSPVRDATGAIVGASKIARDMGPQRESERARGLLASIIESSDDAILSKDLTGVITSWNSGAERLFGYRAEEILGQPARRLIPPELHEEEQRILAKVRAGEGVDHYETVRMARDGRRIEVAITVSPVRSSAGAIIGVSNVTRDLSAAREADRASATLAAIVSGSDDAIISKTLRGIVTSWNPAAERLYGFTAQEMVGQSITRIIPPHLLPEEDHILAKIRARERLDHFETVRMRKDGSLVEVSITVSPVLDSGGRLIGASKIARDITAKRDAQRKKDEFIAVLAHELRNPLAPIRNAIAMFARPGMTDEQRSRAHTIAERQLTHMTRLLDDLLDVSRIANGRVELKRQRVDLAALVAQAVDATRPAFEQKMHRLSVDQAPEPMWLDADPVRLIQIVVNLLTNAAKYTEPGGRVELATRREGPQAVITVSDNGMGFSPQMRSKLFGLFCQDERAVERAAGGLGIGLALVREFVERHGGSVDAHSAGPGEGSRFTVRLPLAAEG